MQLMRKKSDGSFYESFSDLIFCALVLFVALVMVLAANVGVQVDSLKSVQADLEQSKEKLKSAVNSHRYTGASSVPSLSLAIDVRSDEPRFFFIPREYMEAFATPNINETEEQALSRQRNAVVAMTESIEQQRGLSKEDFQSFLKAFSYYATLPTERPWLGIEVEQTDNQVRITKVHPYSSMPAEEVGAVILQVEGQPISSIDELHKCVGSIETSKEHATILIEKNASRVDLKIKLLRHLFEGVTAYMLDISNSSASGWRLVGDGNDMEKATSNSEGRNDRELTFEQTQVLAREVFGSLQLELGATASEDPVTVLQMRVLETEQKLLIGGIPFQLNEVITLLRSIVHGNVAIEFIDESNRATVSVPSWVHTKVLNPAGYINRAPDLEAIEKWLVANDNPEQAN